MFCPICKAEYREGFTCCTGCGVDLVASLDPSPLPDNLALAWRGSDPVGLSAAEAILNDAGIRNYQIADHDQLVWGFAIPRPRYAVWVFKRALERALELVADITERPAFAFGVTPEWAQEESETAELHVSNRAGDDDGSTNEAAPDDIVEDFHPENATVEVWSGEESQMAQMLKACLTENGIGCVVADDSSKLRALVLPSSESRAKEIVRQVVDGIPPQ